MSALTDTLAVRTSLDDVQVDHIARLVGEWQLLADLAFADLLLWVPVAVPAAEAGSVPGFLCVAQCRPTTGPTAYQQDQVGVILQGNRVAPLPHRLRRVPHLPRGRPRLGRRPADPARGDPGAQR